MFAIRANFSSITCYSDAVSTWACGVVFRKDPSGPRGLIDRRKKHMTVERAESGDIILRLYDHPVVTWHKDNSVTIVAYNTRSTMVFVNRCTPDEVRVFATAGRFAVEVGQWDERRIYNVPDQITFRQRDGVWKADKIEPWFVPCVNRPRAKQALQETGYSEFRTWLIVYMQMAKQPDWNRHVRDSDVLTMLGDRTRWRELTEYYAHDWGSHERVLMKIRKIIYRNYDCIENKPVAFL